MTGFAILGWDGTDAGAPARRAAARDRHLEVITRFAADGRLKLGVPLFDAEGSVAGSLMILDVPDELGAREYLLEEPFAREGVWLSYEVLPFRIAPLPYQPLPSGPAPAQPTHTVTLAEDGTDAGAPARRAAAQPAHMAFVREAAAEGVLACGGMILDAGGATRGSIAVTRHATLAEAEAFWAADSYVTGGVWRRVRRWRTRFAPLPYTPLPQE